MKLLDFIADLLFPNSFTCDICGIETFKTNICEHCIKKMSFNNKHTCPVCGRRYVISEICLECKEKPPTFRKAISPLVYEGFSSVLILKFKKDTPYLKEYFAKLIYEKLNEFPKLDCIVYVPMTKRAVRKRDYNQAQLIAKSLSKLSGIPMLKEAVVKIKDSAEQKTLSKKEREENLKSCFKVAKKNEIKGKVILLIDDILTTGATSEAMCKVLYKAGASEVYLATVASVEDKIINDILDLSDF